MQKGIFKKMTSKIFLAVNLQVNKGWYPNYWQIKKKFFLYYNKFFLNFSFSRKCFGQELITVEKSCTKTIEKILKPKWENFSREFIMRASGPSEALSFRPHCRIHRRDSSPARASLQFLQQRSQEIKSGVSVIVQLPWQTTRHKWLAPPPPPPAREIYRVYARYIRAPVALVTDVSPPALPGSSIYSTRGEIGISLGIDLFLHSNDANFKLLLSKSWISRKSL